MRGLDLAARFAREGRRRYGEEVDQLSHALQCAALARRDRADDEVVVAALLHDVGHLVAGPEAVAERPERHHGDAGATLLRPFVSPRIAWLVARHVVAKRYLCTVDPTYAAGLSPASARSLARQGATLSEDERLALETHAWFADALRVRRWDDRAKEADAAFEPLIAYRALLEPRFGRQSWSDAPGIGQ